MTAFVIQRLLLALLVIFGVSVVTFFLTFLSGDPAELMLPPGATAEQMAQLPRASGASTIRSSSSTGGSWAAPCRATSARRCATARRPCR